MKRSIIVVILSCWFVAGLRAQVGPIVRELAEAALEQLGRREAGDLAKFGGEAAVREIFEKAALEGGETAAQQLAGYTERFGLAALRAVEIAPGRMLPALEKMSGDLVGPAIYAAAREPALVTKLVTEYGESALIVAAKHPGVGSEIATTLGREGIDTALRIPTSQAVRLARCAEDIATAPVPPSPKSAVVDAIARAPGRVLDEIEKHPKILLTTAGCATLVAISHDWKDPIFGQPGQPGFADRSLDKVLATSKSPISALIVLFGLGLIALCGTRIFSILRRRDRSKESS